MKPTVFIHTNEKQILGALVSKHSFERFASSTGAFDVKLIHTRDHPFLDAHEGRQYLRDGLKRAWSNDDLQSFTVLRFAPPALMSFEGRSVVVDPDVFCVADPTALITREMQGRAIMARKREGAKSEAWASSVMLLDNAKLRHWQMEKHFEEMFRFERDYMDWITLKSEPQESIGLLETHWNDFDRLTPETRMVHNTRRRTQPWKSGLKVDFRPPEKAGSLRPGHVLHRIRRALVGDYGLLGRYKTHPDPNQERFFFALLKECLDLDIVTRDMIGEQMRLNHVRHDAFEVLARTPSLAVRALFAQLSAAPLMDAKTIWILSHARAGDLDQMLALARALGWPATVKRISFRLPKFAAIPLLARRLFDETRSDPLDPPWPDLVLCAEGRASTIARLIQARSQGAVKTVCLGRPAGSPANFDLVLTTPQYRLPTGPNIVELALPLRPEIRASDGDDPKLDEVARPLTAVLVGGTSLPERLDGEAATGLAAAVVEHAQGGTLVFLTSPRTEPRAAAALLKAVAAPHMLHVWRHGADNPYWRILAAADRVVVTSDSVSMVMDALSAGKSVSVYRLPRHETVRNRVVNWLEGRKGAAWLFDHGIIEARPDRRLLFDKLAAQGRLQWFGETPATESCTTPPAEESPLAVAKVRQLFADSVSG